MNHIADANKMVGEDHLRDATKMVSDTPRTTDRVVFIDGNPWVNASFARGLERELNAANERIKSLIEERDRANRLADWKWNLRGEFESLLGTDKIEEGIEAVKELKLRIKRLEEAGDALKTAGYFGGWADAVNKWVKVKEDKA